MKHNLFRYHISRTLMGLALILLIGVSQSCSEDMEATITLSQKEYTRTADDAFLTVEFNASTRWTATVQDGSDWLFVITKEGDGGDDVLRLALKQNDTKQTRSASVLLSCGSASETIKVTQTGSGLAFEENAFSVEAEELLVLIPFAASSSWTATVDGSPDWVAIDLTEGMAGVFTLRATLKLNPDKADRSAVVKVVSGEDVQMVTITQKANKVEMKLPEDIPNLAMYYKPYEFTETNINMFRSDAKWSWFRYKESEHFFVFWEPGFGLDPNAETVPAELRVDIDDLLAKAEQFFTTNITTLKFAELGKGKSNLDNLKMQIYLLYQTEWLATGSGYDNMIGALWVNPSTCHPVSSTIAHEIGHSFQFQVSADLLLQGVADAGSTRGFRYGYGGNGGNGFWEQTAQWQSFQDYPMEAFTSSNFPVYTDNYHRSIFHEWQRYASYFIHWYWTDKHGIDFIGKLWRESEAPEDAAQAYMRLNNLTVEQFNDEIYDASTKFVTWDIDAIRNNGANYIGKQSYKLFELADKWYQVAYSKCPGTTGYNVIPLNVPPEGTLISAEFAGLMPGSPLAAEDVGEYRNDDMVVQKSTYNDGDAARAGWRYGFVALLADGTRVYGDMHNKANDEAMFTIPANCLKLWFVVTGAPKTYAAHAWDEKESNDDQWPYKVKFGNTDLLGSVVIDPNTDPSDVTVTYDVNIPAGAGYGGINVSMTEDGKIAQIAKAFLMQPSAITNAIIPASKTVAPEEGKIAVGLLLSDGTVSYGYTATGLGFWCDSKGDVIGWGNDSKLFYELNTSTFNFNIGLFPDKSVAGDKYTIKPIFVYTKGGVQYKATIVFNVTIQ